MREKEICKKCGVLVSKNGRHITRDRCKEQHKRKVRQSKIKGYSGNDTDMEMFIL